MVIAYQQLDFCGKKTFEKARIEPPFRLMAEMPNEACFYYVTQGQANVYTSTEKLETRSEEGLVMQCGNFLNEYLSSNELGYCEAIAIHLYPEVLEMIYDKDFPDFLSEVGKIQPIGHQAYPASQLLKSYIDSLLFYFDNPGMVSEELLKLKLKELILLLAKTDNAGAIRQLIGGLFSPATVNFRETIEANLFHDLKLDELARLTNLSLSSFKREFARQYQTSPAKYLRQKKLEQAAKLLKGTNLRISDIAFDCGFNDLAHFSKTFQQAYTCSPSEYRVG